MCAMPYAEFQRQLSRAQLTAREFANLVRMNENSVTNYSQRGTVPSHFAVIVMLMGELADHQIDFRNVIAEAKIERKKPRGLGVDMRARRMP